MKWLIRILILLLLALLFAPFIVYAEETSFAVTAYSEAGLESDFSNEAVEELAPCGSVTLDWLAPTENTDGTPLTDLAGFRVYSRPTTQTELVMVADVASPSVTTFVVEAPCVLPMSPTNLTVTADNLSVYAVDETRNFFALVHVGSVPAGTPCDGSQKMVTADKGPLYVVPREAVDWIGGADAEVVVARCDGS